jgi:hypothetical protein
MRAVDSFIVLNNFGENYHDPDTPFVYDKS